MTAPIDMVLERLEGVEPRGRSKWFARCPAHAERVASFQVTEAQDGTVLLKCFGGCENADVVRALGMEFSDLFPEHLRYRGKPASRDEKPYLSTRDLARIIRKPLAVIAAAGGDMVASGELSVEDHGALLEAVGQVQRVLNEVDDGWGTRWKPQRRK